MGMIGQWLCETLTSGGYVVVLEQGGQFENPLVLTYRNGHISTVTNLWRLTPNPLAIPPEGLLAFTVHIGSGFFAPGYDDRLSYPEASISAKMDTGSVPGATSCWIYPEDSLYSPEIELPEGHSIESVTIQISRRELY